MCTITGVLTQDIGQTGKDAYYNSGFATRFLSATQGKREKIDDSVLNLLAIVDTIIFDKDTGLKDAHLVLHTTPFGVICWPCSPRAVDGQRSFKLIIEKDTRFAYKIITNVGQYVVQETKILPPGAVKDLRDDGKPYGIRMSRATTNPCGMLLYNAKNGFPMARRIIDLQTLIKKLEVPCAKMPTSEIDCVKLLIKYIIPDITDITMAMYADKRNMKLRKGVVFGSVISDMSVADIADDCITHDMKEEIVANAKAYHKAVEALEFGAVALAKPAAAPKKKRKYANKDLMALESAQKLLPVIEGCTINIESLWHLRFKVTYPCWEPPYGTQYVL